MLIYSLLLMAITLALSLAAGWYVRSTYQRYLLAPACAGVTGREAARRILDDAGVHDVEIVETPGELSDHYDPIHRRLALSSDNFHGRSISALAVSAHEAGHAVQHKMAYAPLHMRMAAVGATTFASQIVMWLPLIGMFTGVLSPVATAWILALGWGVIMLFNLVTLPVEYDASARARTLLARSGLMAGPAEERAVGLVLNAAALTYVAAFLTSLLFLLWHLLPLFLGRHDEGTS